MRRSAIGRRERGDERLPSAADGTTRADDEDDKAAALRHRAVLGGPVARARGVGGEAIAVGVGGGDVGGGNGIQGLHINECEGPWAVEVGEDEVGAVAEG